MTTFPLMESEFLLKLRVKMKINCIKCADVESFSYICILEILKRYIIELT